VGARSRIRDRLLARRSRDSNLPLTNARMGRPERSRKLRKQLFGALEIGSHCRGVLRKPSSTIALAKRLCTSTGQGRAPEHARTGSTRSASFSRSSTRGAPQQLIERVGSSVGRRFPAASSSQPSVLAMRLVTSFCSANRSPISCRNARPEMRVGGGVDQLGVDPDLVAGTRTLPSSTYRTQARGRSAWRPPAGLCT